MEIEVKSKFLMEMANLFESSAGRILIAPSRANAERLTFGVWRRL
jgi:hypothetical protein